MIRKNLFRTPTSTPPNTKSYIPLEMSLPVCVPVWLQSLTCPLASPPSGGPKCRLQVGQLSAAGQQCHGSLLVGSPPSPHFPPQARPQRPGQPLHVWSLPLQEGTQTAGNKSNITQRHSLGNEFSILYIIIFNTEQQFACQFQPWNCKYSQISVDFHESWLMTLSHSTVLFTNY